jgi:hypothetical protein
VNEVEEAMHALAERGFWYRRPCGNVVSQLRPELRRAARKRGIRIHVWGDARGGLGARTLDGLPAEEPWRGAVEYLDEIGALRGIAVDAASTCGDCRGNVTRTPAATAGRAPGAKRLRGSTPLRS